MAIETLLLATLAALDMAWTVWVVMTGSAEEANPVMGFYFQLGPLWFVLAKSLLIAAPLVGLELLRRRSPRFVLWLLRISVVAYVLCYIGGFLAANGPRVLRSASNVRVAFNTR